MLSTKAVVVRCSISVDSLVAPADRVFSILHVASDTDLSRTEARFLEYLGFPDC